MTQVLVSIGRELYPTEVSARSFTLRADEPRDLGGSDTGMTPYELLAASLGTCKAITCRMYAERKGWDVEQIAIALRHEKRHAEDCQDCEDPKAVLDHFDVEIQFVGDLTDEQRARLAEIADKCPVHKTLHSDVVVRTELIE